MSKYIWKKKFSHNIFIWFSDKLIAISWTIGRGQQSEYLNQTIKHFFWTKIPSFQTAILSWKKLFSQNKNCSSIARTKNFLWSINRLTLSSCSLISLIVYERNEPLLPLLCLFYSWKVPATYTYIGRSKIQHHLAKGVSSHPNWSLKGYKTTFLYIPITQEQTYNGLSIGHILHVQKDLFSKFISVWR